jgi:hypothetical protein
VKSSDVVNGLPRAGIELSWFLLFPSLGVFQKYLGTNAALAYFGIGSLVLIAIGVRGPILASRIKTISRPWTRLATAVLFGGLVVAFALIYASVGNGNDRGESVIVGARALLTGHYPYYETTRFHNVVTQMPGSLLLAMPFAMLGNAVWQNIFWLAALFVVARALFASDQLALGIIMLMLFASPAALQDFVTGGDLGATAIALLVGMLLLVTLVPDNSEATWKKVAAAALTGMALSSRMNDFLLIPPLFAALSRRARVVDAVFYLGVVGLVFAAVTLPFYWYDPVEFAPLHLHNKFAMFGEVPNGWILFPTLSLLASVVIASHPGNRTVRGWLIQSAFVMAVPVVFLVGLTTYRGSRLSFVFSDYALASVFLGGIGSALRIGSLDEWSVGARRLFDTDRALGSEIQTPAPSSR